MKTVVTETTVENGAAQMDNSDVTTATNQGIYLEIVLKATVFPLLEDEVVIVVVVGDHEAIVEEDVDAAEVLVFTEIDMITEIVVPFMTWKNHLTLLLNFKPCHYLQ